MEDKNIDWQFVIDYITNVLFIVRADLDSEAIDTITMYLTHGEYEMAFEILFIEIMALHSVPSISLTKSLELGKLLKLDEHSVFDGYFWGKFENYVNNHQGEGSD